MENNIRFDRGNYNEETFLFKIDNASFLPSFEGILHEVIKHVPSDYKVSHDYSESDDGRVLYMEFTKPFAFGPFRGTDYIFEVEKFADLEGKTGPYLLYSTIRMKSLLNKAGEITKKVTKLKGETEKDIALTILNLPKVLDRSFPVPNGI